MLHLPELKIDTSTFILNEQLMLLWSPFSLWSLSCRECGSPWIQRKVFPSIHGKLWHRRCIIFYIIAILLHQIYRLMKNWLKNHFNRLFMLITFAKTSDEHFCPFPPSLLLPLSCRTSYLWMVVPIGMLTSLDISLSNTSLIYIPISLYTTVKASVLVYTFAFRYFLL